MSQCDCWICRYDADAPEAKDCPHPHYGHRGDWDKKREYIKKLEAKGAK